MGRAEVFAPGSVEWPEGGVRILPEHRAAEPLTVLPATREGDGRITVTGPATPEALRLVAMGRRFLSVEFLPLRERTTLGGVREIQRAFVPSAALVTDPEYDMTGVEVRRRLGGMRAQFKEGKAYDCACAGGDCSSAKVTTLRVPDLDPVVYWRDFSRPLGQARVTKSGRTVTVEADVPDTSYGRDLLELLRTLGIAANAIVRPYPGPARRGEEPRKEGETLVYALLTPSAWIVTFGDPEGGGDVTDTRGRLLTWL